MWPRCRFFYSTNASLLIYFSPIALFIKYKIFGFVDRQFHLVLENNPKQIRTLIGLKPCFYLTIRLFALDFYRVIVDEGATKTFVEG